jgi:signal transduction histidine kinase
MKILGGVLHTFFQIFNASQRVVMVLAGLVCVVMVWAYYDRVSTFEDAHATLSRASSAELANQVSFILKERQRQVRLFAEDNAALLQKLQSSPENETVRVGIERALKRAMPNFFAFTIATAKGVPIIEDFDGLVGDVCVQDIQKFATNGQHAARIHPNNFRYHFDVMAEWQAVNGSKNLLMVSFEPIELGNLLKAVEQPGHQLMLITAQDPPIMEVTAKGGRDQTPRNDYRLSQEELGRMLISYPVEMSGWKVADFVRPGFFEDFRQQVIVNLAVFFLIFGLVIGVSLAMLRKEERRRIAAENAREELVSMITHEMRTPVTAISGTLSLMSHGLMGDIPKVMQGSFELLQRNVDRLRHLIDDLLESRRIDSAQFSLHKIPTNIQREVSDTILHLKDYVGQLGITVDLRVPDEEFWVDADPVRIQQIISNLISNAAKYSPPGAAVHVEVLSNAQKMVRISVRDCGQGIPDEFKPYVFEKFAKGPAPKDRQLASTGLGLSIVKVLVEAHGGRIGFESVEGKGSVFNVDLPLLDAGAH